MRNQYILCSLAVLALASIAQADTTLGSENFTRADSDTVGNGWTETEGATTEAQIFSNTLRFTPNDAANSPIVKRSLSSSANATMLTWQFTFNWTRTGAENDYEIWMQLGNSAAMVSPSTSNSTGVAINLKWAGPSRGMSAHEGFGYVTGNGATTTQVQTLTGSHTILVTANLAYRTYDIAVDGTTKASNIAFDNNVTIDAIRFYADEVSNGNFSSRAFDNITITAVSLFSDVTATVGLNHQTSSDVTYGSGWLWADLDLDGDLDSIVTGNTARLYVSSNQGASFFMTAAGNIARQAAYIDPDNDGDIDFYAVCYNDYDTEMLFTSNAGAFAGSGTFGFTAATNNEAVAAGDIDGDGWCDLMLFSENGNWAVVNSGSASLAFSGSAASSYGFNDAGDYGNGDYCSAGDVNNDGFPDFFYHYSGGKLFLSDGDGTYTENASGISVVTSNNDKFGSAFGDYDNDGDLDLFCPRYAAGSRGYLWRNVAGTFSDVANSAGITDTTGQRSCCWGDYDNDGDLDLYITTTSGANKLYRNNGSGSFSLVTQDNTDASGNGHDAVFVDYDNDGDLDLAVVREDTTNVLYKNLLNNNRYLKVRAIGAGDGATNVACIGTRVELYNSTGSTLLQRRDIGVARGYAGTAPLWVHFGGVTASTTYIVRVHFQSGYIDTTVVPQSTTTTIGSVTINQMLTVLEPEPEPLRVIRWMEKDPH